MSTPKQAVIMPFEAKDIIQILIDSYGLSLVTLAKQLQVSIRTIYRIKAGAAVSDQLMCDIIALYCRYAMETN